MLNKGRTRVTFLTVLLSFCITLVSCTIDGNTTTNEITGQDLIDMGRKYNKPFLRLIGKALMDTECRTKTCSPWTEWSACKIFVGEFGMKERWRVCGNSCRADIRDRNETEASVCQVVACPSASGYVRTREGFCLKYYTTAKTKEAARTICKKDDGYLVNINSHRKWTAFTTVCEKNNVTSDYIYIDGERKDNKSSWTFSYEDDITGYTNWGDNDPDNGSTDLCRIAHISNPAGVYDNECTTARPFMCEIVAAV